jgi:hypothetical protein
LRDLFDDERGRAPQFTSPGYQAENAGPHKPTFGPDGLAPRRMEAAIYSSDGSFILKRRQAGKRRSGLACAMASVIPSVRLLNESDYRLEGENA